MTEYYAITDIEYQGGDKFFSFPFSYIKDDYIHVFINEEETQNYTFNLDNQIVVNDDLVEGDIVSIRRTTPIKNKLVTFSNTSILSADVQNLAQDQLFDVVQEAYDLQLRYEDKINKQVENFENKIQTELSTFQKNITAQMEEFSEEIITAVEMKKERLETALTTCETYAEQAQQLVQLLDLDSYYTKEEVDTRINSSFENYYTKTETQNLIKNTNINLDNYYTKSETKALIDNALSDIEKALETV